MFDLLYSVMYNTHLKGGEENILLPWISKVH